MRKSFLFWSILCSAVVVGLFIVKHRVQGLEEKLQTLNSDIIADQNAIQVLEAEWSFLNQPARLEELSRRLLGMQAPEPGQTVTMTEFLRQPPEPKAQPEAGTRLATVRRKETEKKPVVANDDWLTPILAKLKKGE